MQWAVAVQLPPTIADFKNQHLRSQEIREVKWKNPEISA